MGTIVMVKVSVLTVPCEWVNIKHYNELNITHEIWSGDTEESFDMVLEVV